MAGVITITQAAHDLCGITSLHIRGWSSDYTVLATDHTSLTIQAPMRDPEREEFWTFPRPVDGALRCFTSLLGRPYLLTRINPTTGDPWMMVLWVPAIRLSDLRIEFVS